MSQIIQRPEQLAELTRNIKEPLPFPRLPRVHLRLITKMLAMAWSEILSRHQSDIQTNDEPSITTLMESCLNNLRETVSKWNDLTSGVHRGKELINYDGSHLEKRSDLPIFLTRRNANFPFIVECKLIDKSTDKRVRLYCKEGIIRFINGDYAWYDQQAIMLAYVRDDSTIASTLTPHLAEYQKKKSDPFASEQLPEVIEGTDMDLACSKHERQFYYIHQMPRIPSAIVVWHLWLSTSTS